MKKLVVLDMRELKYKRFLLLFFEQFKLKLIQLVHIMKGVVIFILFVLSVFLLGLNVMNEFL